MRRSCSLIATLALMAACSDNTTSTPPPDTGVDAATDTAADLGAPDTGQPDVMDAAPDVTDAGVMDVVDETTDAADGGDDASDAADAADATDATDVPMDVCPDALPDGNCLSCAAGERVCDGVCARPDDPAHGCGGPSCAACSYANATATCSAGACAFEHCAMGYSDCNMNTADGCEVPSGTDPNNCGTCGHACAIANGTAGCAMGVCTVASCNAGRGDCDSMAANGCETDTNTTLAHCGACGTACAPANGTGACAAGLCSVASCNAGFANCNAMSADGCEANTQTDIANCGRCGNACRLDHATSVCTSGSCAVMACEANFADCDHNPANGCEIDLRVSAPNCSMCGQACSYTNAAGVCRDSVCGLGTCNTGFSNCDGDPGNGCEINSGADPMNCGGCGTACRIPNAEPSCVSGACRIGTCDGTFRNCDGSITNGCEVDTASSLANCGACGAACSLAHAIPVCRDSVCNIASCATGFTDCDGASANGCEVNTQSDLHNCGGCGDECALPHAAETCSGGRCLLGTCDFGYANCNDTAADGCESFLASDGANCGRCGNVCAGGFFCSSGACVPLPV